MSYVEGSSSTGENCEVRPNLWRNMEESSISMPYMEESSTTGQTCELRPDLWSNLPNHTLEKVLSKLPFSSLFRFRVVCKEWRALIESPEFTRLGSSWKPVTFYYHPGGLLEKEGVHVDAFLSFPTLTKKERKGTLIRPGINHLLVRGEWKRHFLPFSEPSSSYPLLAVDEGLFCFGDAQKPGQFTVYNPLSRKWTRLELPFTLSSSSRDDPKVYNVLLVGLAMNRENRTYQVLVAGLQHAGSRSFIYNSKTNSWRASESFSPPHYPLFQRSMCCRGNLFWVLGWRDSWNAKRLLKYDFDLDKWTSTGVQSTLVAANRDHVFLFSLRDRDASTSQRNRDACAILGPEIKVLGKEVEQLLLKRRSNQNVSPFVWLSHETRISRILAQGDCLYFLYHPHPLKMLVYGPQTLWSWVPRSRHVCSEDSFGVFTPTF